MRGAQQVYSSVSGFSRKPHSGILAVIQRQRTLKTELSKNLVKLTAKSLTALARLHFNQGVLNSKKMGNRVNVGSGVRLSHRGKTAAFPFQLKQEKQIPLNDDPIEKKGLAP